MSKIAIIAGDQSQWDVQQDPRVYAEYRKLLSWAADNFIPIFWEPSSPLSSAENGIASSSLVVEYLRQKAPEFLPDQIINVGHPTISRSFTDLLENLPAVSFEPEIAAWHDQGKFTPHTAENFEELVRSVNIQGPETEQKEFADFLSLLSSTIAEVFEESTYAAKNSIRQNLSGTRFDENCLFGLHAVYSLWNTLAHISEENSEIEYRIIVGSSNAVRYLHHVMKFSSVLPNIKIYANRGLAGIDGLISTAHGIALSKPNKGFSEVKTFLLLGDVSALHDVGGLLLGSTEKQPDLTIMVLNDQGGGIFGLLEHGQEAKKNKEAAQTVERFLVTPHNVSFKDLARAYGLNYYLVRTVSEIDETIKNRVARQDIRNQSLPRTFVEIQIDKSHNFEFMKYFKEEIFRALEKI